MKNRHALTCAVFTFLTLILTTKLALAGTAVVQVVQPAIPEPTTLALVGIGIAGLGLARFFKK